MMLKEAFWVKVLGVMMGMARDWSAEGTQLRGSNLWPAEPSAEDNWTGIGHFLGDKIGKSGDGQTCQFSEKMSRNFSNTKGTDPFGYHKSNLAANTPKLIPLKKPNKFP